MISIFVLVVLTSGILLHGLALDHRSTSPSDPKAHRNLDDHTRAHMINETRKCDNGSHVITNDFVEYCSNYKCPGLPLRLNETGFNRYYSCLNIGEQYLLNHTCLDKNITYDDPIPQVGNHRPSWPVYGEYNCIPPQRWLHSIEHGAVVMLYHPCANPLEVDKLRTIVKSCLRRYIISAYELVPVNRPLALVAWGCKFLMKTVSQEKVIKFIKKYANHGNEASYLYEDGRYNYSLIAKAEVPAGSTFHEKVICPKQNFPEADSQH